MTPHTTHTPGPTCTCRIWNAQVETGIGMFDEIRVEACPLCTAAPAMYEAIRKVIEHRAKEYLDNTIEPYCSLVAALAQADGRT